MEYPGLLNWANSIRQTMANDPGRQLFKDQVQIHGFSFLDDYLDNIVSGQRQDPLIELVKTPGRKKAALKKPNYHQQINSQEPIEVPTAPSSQLLYDRDYALADIQEEDVEMPVKLIDKPIPPPSFPTLPEPIPLRTSSKPPRDPSIHAVLLGAATPGALTDIQEEDVEMPVKLIDKPIPPPSFPTVPDPIPLRTSTKPPRDPSVNAVLLGAATPGALTDIQEEDVETSVKLIDKPIPPPSFPALPEPIPLRKSTKPPRDPSINAVLLGTATPGAPLGGMRSSWLMKAREANIDKLSKKSHPPGMGSSEVGASSSLAIQGTKRKSDVVFSLPQIGIIREDERPLKLAKTSESEVETDIESQPPVVVESAPEGVFDRLKKVVEDLGIRVDRKVEERKQPEVMKVLQMAAVAAKKQQEEADKKAARLKEMESRRQLAIQRKAEEEKAKVLEEERKMKEEAERRKKEREPIKYVMKKKEDDTMKRRKIEMEKKQEIKKPSSSILIGKAHLKSVLKSSSSTNPSHVYGSSSQQDSSILAQSQTAARVKVQIDVPKPVKHVVPSEDIELPDINSEYSDSDDEDRVRTFNPPEWAQSPELRQALEMQSTMNPDDIFGAVRPLKMEEIFKSRTSRFRARTSSANWTGTDRLTMQEQGEYARRMGFK